MVRFTEPEVRSMGRNTSGVKGIELDDAIVVGAEVVKPSDMILIVTEKGYGKKTSVDEYRLTHRGSKGVKALNVTDKNGMMIALKRVTNDDDKDLMLMTDSGIIIRMPLDQVSTLKRATQGTRLINLKDNQKVATVAVVDKTDESEETVQEEEQ
jgi:DNA gyrase subunit A